MYYYEFKGILYKINKERVKIMLKTKTSKSIWIIATVVITMFLNILVSYKTLLAGENYEIIAKNCDKVIPEPLHIASRVNIFGIVFLL